MLQTTLMQRLGLRLPVVQAPMAGTSTPAMAAAVADAGGLGSVALGALDAEKARLAIAQTRELTSAPFAVNLFCHRPGVADAAREAAWLKALQPRFAEFGAQAPLELKQIYTSFLADEDMLQMLLDTRPAVISMHFGLPPKKTLDALRAAGIYLMATATQPDEARRVAEAGVDAIVAQGVEAGGHRGTFDDTVRDEGLGTLALTQLLAQRFELPVIAAGGIMDGRGIAAALALGAQAAQLGTAFITCPESNADAAHRAALMGHEHVATTFTRAISGRRARSVVNRFTELGEDHSLPDLPDYPMVYDAGKALNAAAKAKGETGYGAQWAGQAAALSRGLPVKELMTALEQELGIQMQEWR